MTSPRVAAGAAPRTDRSSRGAERMLRLAGDARLGVALLLVAGAANGVAAVLPGGPALLDAWPYAVLLGMLALSGVAAVAVRSPAIWREWRRPAAVQASGGTHRMSLPTATPEAVERALRSRGYRTRVEVHRARWAVHGVRRGWSRYAGLASHLALVVVVLGAAIGVAFGSETTFSLQRGEQALLDVPRPGFASAVRFETFDAEFGPDGRPRRLDTTVTLLRDGQPIRDTVLRVNEPSEFDGYLVHAWTYGPAVRLRVATLGGSPLLDAAVPLDGGRDGRAIGSAELPTAGVTLGLALTDADRNEIGISVVDSAGLVDTGRLVPGERVRIGPLEVELAGFDAWVTFFARRDPGLPIVLAGAALLSASLAVAFWLPRRRVTVRPAGGGMELLLRGERFDRPDGELHDLAASLGSAA
ncbi:MAG: cytochrome c biogenesis protein ResB [Candidatus Limnocylindria bacterium]